MKLSEGKIDGIRFYYREGFSDLKTFEEVIGNKTYLKKGIPLSAVSVGWIAVAMLGRSHYWRVHTVQM